MAKDDYADLRDIARRAHERSIAERSADSHHVLVVTTEHGTKYMLDYERGMWSRRDGRCRYRNDRGGWEGPERIWSIAFGHRPDGDDPADREEAERLGVSGYIREHWDCSRRAPVPGECLYVTSRDLWYVSTPVKSVRSVRRNDLRFGWNADLRRSGNRD